MPKTLLTLFTLVPGLIIGQGSFEPSAGIAGTSAIHKDSSIISNWAIGCISNRGPQDIAVTNSPLVSVGDDYMATGVSGANGVISLGDGGEAILTFQYPIMNGTGWDFAVFENGFSDDFLELAFVEVSSDGINFFRFPATSEIQTSSQTDAFGSTNATEINNLAGKYKAQYGTPFDLEELNGIVGLNINHITHVKIIDVIGTINETYATYDQYGTIINDPYPTDFNSGGFDLDAVGVINQDNSLSTERHLSSNLSVFPSISSDRIKITSTSDINQKFWIFTTDGRLIYESDITENEEFVDISQWTPGYYTIVTASSSYKFMKI